MKNLAIISTASFYLLLTTGMFVCILDCSSKYLVSNIQSKAGHGEHDGNNHKEKSCTRDKDCSCCKKHGNYAVTENIKPFNDHQFLDASFISVINYFSFSPIRNILTKAKWHLNNAPPPGINGPGIYIFIRSLLI